MLSAGANAPDFTLATDDGTLLQLSEALRAGHVVLYFYPRDFTLGCIKEACDFRDNYAALREEGAVLIGVSPDDAASHHRFKAKYALPFPLAADTDHALARLFDAHREFPLPGARRVTYVIERGGVIRGAFHHELAIGLFQDDVLRTLRGINLHAQQRTASGES